MNNSNHGTPNLQNLDQAGKIKFDRQRGYCFVQLNPGIYTIEAVKLAAHQLSGDLNIIIDENREKVISLEIFLKDGSQDIKTFYWKFNDALLAYSAYLIQSERNKELREAILKRALTPGCAIDV